MCWNIFKAIHYLKLNTSKVEGGRRNTFTYYTISIKATPKVIKYRKSLLHELRSIYEKDLFKNEIERALKKYGTGNSDHIDYEVIKEEYNDIMSIVVQLQTDSLYHCTVVEHLKRVFEKAEIEFDNEIIDKFIYSPKNVIFQNLLKEFQEQEKTSESRRELDDFPNCSRAYN